MEMEREASIIGGESFWWEHVEPVAVVGPLRLTIITTQLPAATTIIAATDSEHYDYHCSTEPTMEPSPSPTDD